MTHDCSAPAVLRLLGALFNVAASNIRAHVRELGLTPDDLSSMVMSELCGMVAEEPPARPGAPDDLCALCGHRRADHCGCGAHCMAPVAPAFYDEDPDQLEALLFLWRDLGDVELSKALSNPCGWHGCANCPTGFEPRVAGARP